LLAPRNKGTLSLPNEDVPFGLADRLASDEPSKIETID